MRRYSVKETFYTLQGEGQWAGRPAVFLRFARCNLWSGHERDRATAVCQFCDTDFVGGERLGLLELTERVRELWPVSWTAGRERRIVVCTGGEPLLQLDAELVDRLWANGFYVHVETNGTLPLPRAVDWVTLSPKAGAPIVLTEADELKLVYPQAGLGPDDLDGFSAGMRWLQPMDGPERDANTAAAVAYCLAHPEWGLSLQTHKFIGIP